MILPLLKFTSIGLALGLLSACVPEGQEVSKTPTTADVEYLKVDTRLMSPELVNMVVTIRNPRTPIDVVAYVECAAAQYTLIRGFGFAGRVKLDVDEEKNGVWAGNAIYTLSNAHPGGRHTIDAEVTVEDCTSNNVPTV